MHPGSGVTWNHVGDAYRATCRFAESKEQYTKARERPISFGEDYDL